MRPNDWSNQGAVATYSYDGANRLTGQVLLGGCATFIYDRLNRMSTKWHQGEAPLTMSYNRPSYLVWAASGDVITSYTYNNVGSPLTENLTGAVTTFAYDGENRMTKMANPDGSVLTNTYAGGGLRRTWQSTGQPVFTQVWDGSDYLGEVQ